MTLYVSCHALSSLFIIGDKSVSQLRGTYVMYIRKLCVLKCVKGTQANLKVWETIGFHFE